MSSGQSIEASASASVLPVNICWWWGNNRAVFQEPNAHTEVIILHLGGGGLGSNRRTQRYHYAYSLRKNQDSIPHLHYCFLITAPLFLHSITSPISNVWKCPLGLRGGQRGWMKLISWTKNKGHQRNFYFGKSLGLHLTRFRE